MKPEELRIGNYVKYDLGGDTMKVTSIHQTKIRAYFLDNSGFREQDFEPIKLTEEWLIKFGALRKEDGMYYIDEFEFSIGADHVKVFYGKRFLVDKEYVHSLQNLYHSLTGKELTIKK